VNSTATRKATPAQFELIRTLLGELAEISELGKGLAHAARVTLNDLRAEGRFDFAAASKAITVIKNNKATARTELAKEQAAAAPKAQPKPRREIPAVPDGRYALPGKDDAEAVRFFKVEVDGTFYRVYAQASDELHQLRFPSFIKVLQEIIDFGTKDSAILYGKELGVCGRCGAALTSKWRFEGIGPECSKKEF
jgi:hypothetical protein